MRGTIKVPLYFMSSLFSSNFFKYPFFFTTFRKLEATEKISLLFLTALNYNFFDMIMCGKGTMDDSIVSCIATLINYLCCPFQKFCTSNILFEYFPFQQFSTLAADRQLLICLSHTTSSRSCKRNNCLSSQVIAFQKCIDNRWCHIPPYRIVKCSQFPSCVDFTGFNGIQNCVYCYYLSFFSKIALKHRPHYFHI